MTFSIFYLQYLLHIIGLAVVPTTHKVRCESFKKVNHRDINICPRKMNNSQKINVIKLLLEWQKALHVFNDKRCLLLNFGYKNNLPLPQMKMSLDKDSKDHLNVVTHANNFPNKCFIVVIGGKYLDKVDDVMEMENISSLVPSAVFLMAEKPGQDIKFNVSTRHRRSPTMYQVPATRSSVVQFAMTCPSMSHSFTFTLHMRRRGSTLHTTMHHNNILLYMMRRGRW